MLCDWNPFFFLFFFWGGWGWGGAGSYAFGIEHRTGSEMPRVGSIVHHLRIYRVKPRLNPSKKTKKLK